MKINWFSPIEPAQTGIAQYSHIIIPWLARQAEVCVWTSQPEWDKSIELHAKICEYRPDAMPWPELNRADLTFFNMGNNVEFHLDIWLASIQYPGIVILHDAFYPDFFNGVRERVREGRVPPHFQIPERFQAELVPGADGSLLLQAVLHKSVAALVHSPAEFERLTGALNCPLLYAPFPYKGATESKLQDWAVLQNTKRQKARLVTFGYLNSNRRVEAIVEVLARFKGQFELHLYGPLANSDAIQARIKTLGLEDSVTMSGGYVKDIDTALAQADLAINLRNPTMGEASLSQLQIWDHALPSIVTRVGWYSHLPEDSVLFVRPESEQDDLATHLRAYLENRDRMTQIGANGRRTLLANHSPEEYAKSLAGLTDQVQSFQCGAAAQSLGGRIGADLKRWFDPACDGFTSRIAKEIGQIFG